MAASITIRKTLPARWLLHGGLFIAVRLTNALLPISTLLSVVVAHNQGFGLLPLLGANFWVSLCVWGLASSLVEYLFHLVSHRFSLLWAFHRVHHSDEVVDASTGFRHHPVEAILIALPAALLAFVLAPTLDAMVAWYAISVAFSFFTHSHIQLPIGVLNGMEKILATPRIHRVHHSSYEAQTNSNYGDVFTFWDRLFGTYCTEEPKKLGLDDSALSGKNARDFDTLLVEPFKFAWRKVR